MYHAPAMSGLCGRLHFEQINGARKRHLDSLVPFEFVFAQADVIPRASRVRLFAHYVLKFRKRRAVLAFIDKAPRCAPNPKPQPSPQTE